MLAQIKREFASPKKDNSGAIHCIGATSRRLSFSLSQEAQLPFTHSTGASFDQLKRSFDLGASSLYIYVYICILAQV